ncbi:carbohydrate ABC transporter permease [Entomospira culicis]|uniref:Carbohydrate ABC transporter permease n=1 Tax=Entomospira culicis TaxID=2719989 RepID=A0A968GK33_9SPIO|nr:carbohydrate ABC transporter permease [Entomospira culicis]NIZ19888.1 carbohydrate ABC transporter permease [Entomospira culicis]NIZ70155.1 carbohydrate ABC transporter permease [Entomospira culicis]WDI37988.1 carbohydrate ABC transporter permease [Entomospira culicis]WDI39611.1 carbohydrate ABC transporter permease [Entomospira culicis]
MVHRRSMMDHVNTAFMAIFTLSILIPLFNVLALSFSDPFAVDVFIWPKEFTTESYKQVFNDPRIYRAFVISILRTVVGVSTSIIFTGIVAYAMSKNDLWGRSLYMKMGILTMFIGGGMIPTFLLYRQLGLLNNFMVYIIPALFSFYNMIIFMNFFRELPKELEESARIDGASQWTIFFRIIIPLSIPVVLTIALFNGVGHWNDYMTAKLYIANKESIHPIQMFLYNMILASAARDMQNLPVEVGMTTTKSLQLATMVITTAPIVMVYPFIQKYFIKGMLVGSVK